LNPRTGLCLTRIIARKDTAGVRYTDAFTREGLNRMLTGIVGRMSHTSCNPVAKPPVRHQSARTTSGVSSKLATHGHWRAFDQRGLSTREVKDWLSCPNDRMLWTAGFDGVELHARNGYLVKQLISAHTNRVIDEWRFAAEPFPLLREIPCAFAGDRGKERVGVRSLRCSRPQITKNPVYLGWSEEDPHQLHRRQ